MREISNWANRNIKYVFTFPTLLFILLMIAFPLVYTIILSLHSWRMSVNIPWKWTGIENYTALLSSSRFWSAVNRTFKFAVIALSIQIVLGLAIALFLNREYKGKNLVKTSFLLPMVATPVAIGMVWKLIYEPNIGILNYIIRNWLSGPKLDWLGSTELALYSLIIVDIWQWTPMVMLIILAGLTSIPHELYESAMVDGANKIRIIQKITLPLLRPTIFTAVLLRLIDVLKTFDIIYSTTLGGPGFSTETLNILSYRQAFEFMEFGEASATLIVFFFIVLLIAALTIKAKSKTEVHLS